jgi:hypothetical protein
LWLGKKLYWKPAVVQPNKAQSKPQNNQMLSN